MVGHQWRLRPPVSELPYNPSLLLYRPCETCGVGFVPAMPKTSPRQDSVAPSRRPELFRREVLRTGEFEAGNTGGEIGGVEKRTRNSECLLGTCFDIEGTLLEVATTTCSLWRDRGFRTALERFFDRKHFLTFRWRNNEHVRSTKHRYRQWVAKAVSREPDRCMCGELPPCAA